METVLSRLWAMQLGRRSSSESPPGNLATGLDPGRDTPARWKKCLRFRQQGPREAILGHLDGLLMLLKASRNWRLYLEGSVRASVAHRGECAPAMARTCVVLVRAQRLPGRKRPIRQPHVRLYQQTFQRARTLDSGAVAAVVPRLAFSFGVRRPAPGGASLGRAPAACVRG